MLLTRDFISRRDLMTYFPPGNAQFPQLRKMIGRTCFIAKKSPKYPGKELNRVIKPKAPKSFSGRKKIDSLPNYRFPPLPSASFPPIAESRIPEKKKINPLNIRTHPHFFFSLPVIIYFRWRQTEKKSPNKKVANKIMTTLLDVPRAERKSRITHNDKTRTCKLDIVPRGKERIKKNKE